MSVPYTPPEHNVTAFNCPTCGAFSSQKWGSLGATWFSSVSYVEGLTSSLCVHCSAWAIWLDRTMIYPSGGSAPLPNPDLPPDLQTDYEEARAILNRSLRGAAALLRLLIQKLCIHLGEPGKSIDTDIGSLVKKQLPIGVQQALDTVRVIGNEAVHPGQIDSRDDVATASVLFVLVNLIADKMLTEKKQLAAIYASLPKPKLDGIEARDRKALPPPP